MQDKLSLIIVILFGIFVLFEIGVSIVKFFKKPKDQQIKDLKEWLLYAVVKAEKYLGSGTGELKLRYVYNLAISKFPFVSVFIPFETFSKYVDEALDQMKDILDKNETCKKTINELYMENTKKTFLSKLKNYLYKLYQKL